MSYMVIFWLIVAVTLGVIESLTLSITSIWGAISAVFCAVVCYFGVSFKISVYLFILLTFLLLLATRPIVKKFLVKEKIPTNADRIIGAEGLVTRKISNKVPGEVKVRGQVWSAVSETEIEIYEGETVYIRCIDGVKLIVDKL